ncbi:hypothetical protein B0H19DRAFT_1167302 [Mycena capillaripes]|nr:hypothetical protein B0H19DRAFT_1167302 [Mycena capillaripes]
MPNGNVAFDAKHRDNAEITRTIIIVNTEGDRTWLHTEFRVPSYLTPKGQIFVSAILNPALCTGACSATVGRKRFARMIWLPITVAFKHLPLANGGIVLLSLTPLKLCNLSVFSGVGNVIYAVSRD